LLGVYNRKLVVDISAWELGSFSKPFAKMKDGFGKRGDGWKSSDVHGKGAEVGAL